MWQLTPHQRVLGARAVAGDVAGKAQLTVGTDQAADLIWSLNSPELHTLLTRGRGWSQDDYARWLSASLRRSLLPCTHPSAGATQS